MSDVAVQHRKKFIAYFLEHELTETSSVFREMVADISKMDVRARTSIRITFTKIKMAVRPWHCRKRNFLINQNISIYLDLKSVIRAFILWTATCISNNNVLYVQNGCLTDLVQAVMILFQSA